MPNTQKHVAVALLVNKNEILLQRDIHPIQGDENLDVFGAIITDDNQPEQSIRALLTKNGFPTDIPLEPFGYILNLIHKPGENVALHSYIFLGRVKDDVRAKIPTDSEYLWCRPSDIINDRRTKRITKFLEGVCSPEPFNHIHEENQFGRWINAETVRWELLDGAIPSYPATDPTS